MITFNINMFVKELLEYREFDRTTPVPKVSMIQSYTIDEVTEWVKVNGISKPLELSIYQDKALLTDGNHRIIAADRLNYNVVPVIVTYYETFEELNNAFYKHTIDRFKNLIVCGK